MELQKTPAARAGFLILFLGNTLALMISFYGAIWIRYQISLWPIIYQQPILPSLLIFTGLGQFIFYLFDLYNLRIKPNSLSLVLSIFISILITAAVMGGSYYFIPSLTHGRWILALATLLAMVLVSSWWLIYNHTFKIPGIRQRVLIVGSSQIGEAVAREILSNPDLGYCLVGFIDECMAGRYSNPEDTVKVWGKGDNKFWTVPLIGTLGEFDQIVKNNRIDLITVALAERRMVFPLQILLNCKLNGIKVYEAIDFYEQLTGKILVQGLRPSWLIFCQGFNKSKTNEVLKRVLDVVISALGLILAAPLMAVTAILIKLESPGPIIFTQERVGKGEKTFQVYKFRSMTVDAEAKTGPVWATDKDPRITRVGWVIRKFRIDELPQLLNILKGDMSFVGPRPERPHFVETLKKEIPYYPVRLTVKPGLTGWAQVNFPYGSSKEDALEKLQYDLFYIKNLSLFLDLVILLKTMSVIILAKGAK
ncbi:MAG TPA: TIGR03013 family XrtA/PEP-CTERM system glycosyltransferase [Candidatus Limnocylindrales bacterium]|nr:TIGR03013 family XrtA/PEP-CTERM system glycosyltransferase [Candidatus Limnocylindrales bacterium]